MLEFIKMFGLGILYTILFPFIIIIFAVYIAYVFCNYLVLEVINIFGFFFGYNFTVETTLDKKLNSMRNSSVNESTEKKEEVATSNIKFDNFFLSEEDEDVLRGSDEHE